MVDWIILSKTSGTGNATIDVTVQKNETELSRAANLTIKTASGLSEEVAITQDAGVKMYSAINAELTISDIPAGGIINSAEPITLTYSQTWGWGSETGGGIITEGAEVSYIKVSGTNISITQDGKISVPSKSSSVSGRTKLGTIDAIIKLNGKQATCEVDVYQQANQLISTEYEDAEIRVTESYTIPASGGTQQIDAKIFCYEVKKYTSGTTENTGIESSTGVLYVEQAPVTGFSVSQSGLVTAQPNSSITSRTFKVDVGGTLPDGVQIPAESRKVVTITQLGQEETLQVEPTSINFSQGGGTETIDITSNVVWTIE